MFIIGRKLNMSQVWDDENKVVVTTAIKCLPNELIGFKTEKQDGYAAAIVKCGKLLKEFRLFSNSDSDLKKGDKITVESFAPGDKVKIIGKSKGKGFQGVVKRHGFKGGKASHGHRHDLKRSGSIGSAFPQHVMKGKKMAGRMGNRKVSIKAALIAEVDKENNLLLIKGSVPGKRGNLVFIRKR